MDILTGALKVVLQTYRVKCDEVENEVENVFKTYREVIDKMGKVSLSHINRLLILRNSRCFKRAGRIKT